MWKVIKISSDCLRWFKNEKEVAIIYKEGDLWKGHVLGASVEASGSSYSEVAEKVIKIAKDCGWD